jgi:hypothetical protein
MEKDKLRLVMESVHWVIKTFFDLSKLDKEKKSMPLLKVETKPPNHKHLIRLTLMPVSMKLIIRGVQGR